MRIHFYKYAIPVVLLLLDASCIKQELGQPVPKKEDLGPTTEMDFTLELESSVESSDNGKTFLDGNKIFWSAGDKVGIWDGVALNVFTAEQRDEKLVFTGSAVDTDTYWAIYPWLDDICVDTSGPSPVFTVYVPNEQHACKGGFSSGSCLSIGKSETDAHIIKMKNVCGFLKFSFPVAKINAQKPGSLDCIALTTCSGAKISGKIDITVDGSGDPYLQSTQRQNGDDTIKFKFDNEIPEAGCTYYICALPSDLGGNDGGIELDFTRSNDCAVASKIGGTGKNNILVRNNVLDLGQLTPDWTPRDGEEPDDPVADPSGSFDYSLLSGTSHPKVYMTDEDFRVLKQLLKDGSYPALSQWNENLLAYATSNLGKKIPTEAEYRAEYPDFNDHSSNDWFTYKSLHRSIIAHGANNRLINDAYAYRVTGEKKYLDDAIVVFDQLCEDPDWCPDNGLSMAEIALGFGIAYDWLYYDLSLEERTKIRSNIVNKALLAKKNYSQKTNVGQVNNAGMMAALVAIYEKGKNAVKNEIELSLDGISYLVNNMYGITGSTFEGYGYWNYGNTFQTIYNEILLTAFGTDNGLSEVGGFKSTGSFMLFLSDYLEPFKYADGGSSDVGIQPALWWFAAHYQNPSYLVNELYLLDKQPSSGRGRTMFIMPCVLSKYPKINLMSAMPPASSVWVDSNESKCPVLIARTSWTNTERDKYLGLKGGLAKVNHGHMDVGSFAYHSNGKVWCTDVGHKSYYTYTTKGASGYEQTDSGWRPLAYNAMGHTTMCFANYCGDIKKTYPTDHIVTGKATILESFNSAEEKGGKLDLTPIYVGQVSSATRKAVIYKDSYLKVEDEIKALPDEDAELVWRFVTPAEIAISEGMIILSQGSETMYLVQTCSNQDIVITPHNWGGYSDARPGPEFGWEAGTPAWDESHPGNYIAGFTLTIPKGTSVSITTTLSPFRPGNKEAGTEAETPEFGDDKYDW